MDPLSTTFAKAVDDLAAKIFIPALISSYFVEFGPWIRDTTGLGLFWTYVIVVIFGALSASFILILLIEISIHLFKGKDISAEFGVVLMPLGFAGLFPEQFSDLEIPYGQVTGVAILAWAFMLVKGKRFFYGHFWDD